ncbi:MAG: rhomboid family intramembrane serine protease [Verrucomicrobia bacterium]|nr:MAG: rhomboid family intramembrane serine protease [Verrucomicrobiota bacterium]
MITLSLVLINVLVFFWEASLGQRLGDALLQLAILPARYTDAEIARLFNPAEQIVPFFASMFLHGGWIHLIGNMWTLWIFGDNVEDRLGHGKFLLFYLASGIVAALFHIYTNAGSRVPTIGASGAVAGIMGAYFRFFPHARVETVIPPFFFGPVFVLPALVFLGWWFLLQFFNGALSLAASGNAFGGIAWWAHVGGFVFGLVVCLFARRRPARGLDYDEV